MSYGWRGFAHFEVTASHPGSPVNSTRNSFKPSENRRFVFGIKVLNGLSSPADHKFTDFAEPQYRASRNNTDQPITDG